MQDSTNMPLPRTEDHVREEAVGGTHLGRSYYMSFRLLGSMMAMSLSLCAAYVGYLLPVGILSYINSDVGKLKALMSIGACTKLFTAGPDPDFSLIPVAWSISNAIAYLVVGRLSDIFGRRYFFLGGNVLGIIGMIMCAVAKSIPTIIGGNVFIGIAAAVSLSFYYAAGELVPVKDRGYWYFAIFVPVIPFAMIGSFIGK